ncbi:FAD-dependent oxidoreductase [Sulfurovum sp. NBC37-1]|uniref:FAD-dependent oxidoreductase n=1 Tax=Sulfurovum sp. (strain NBC37-1) TaxID=387093 RepID=UPI0001587565|nr:FAD-dependent oxidoreductase [Sulfurovum sp. NBC37-1]BAF71812.1 FAD-dependent pyridine nucleotide-disulphide oxidoreductase [Sulfurovum sp. NBC37-1]
METITCDVLIIGGGPAGGVCAVTAKMNYPQKKVLVVREMEVQMVPCAIPYVFGTTLGSSEKNVASCAKAEEMGIETIIAKVEEVNTEAKMARTSAHEIHFDKLVFATGSVPFVHASLQPSLAFEGVFTVPKNKQLIDKAKTYIDNVKNIVVVGTGFIGIEMAMELKESGKNVTVIGGSKHILKGTFDSEVAMQAEEILLAHDVAFISEDRVSGVLDDNGSKIVRGVQLKSGRVVPAQAVILATGYKPNTQLAKEAGLFLGHYGGIWVDEYMRTANHDVFAVGDCCARRGFISKVPSKVMLASTSAAEGRMAGSSLFGFKYLKGFSGTIAIFSTMVGTTAFSSAGITEEEARKSGADIVVGSFTGMNRHPGSIPGAHKQFVKLVAMRHSGQIIGGQIVGGNETGEMINIIGVMIETKMTIYQVMSMQVATQPMLTAAPTNYPIVMAAAMIAQKIENH